MQQVRAEVKSNTVVPFDYLFERESAAWDPEFATEGELPVPDSIGETALVEKDQLLRVEPGAIEPVRTNKLATVEEARGGYPSIRSWKQVRGLVPRLGAAREKDEDALKLASPDSGSFIIVSLRRRRRDRNNNT